jgi:hypothetical protein
MENIFNKNTIPYDFFNVSFNISEDLYDYLYDNLFDENNTFRWNLQIALTTSIDGKNI